MARIDPRLLERIAEKKGINTKAAYPLISAVVQETYLSRDLAALMVASRLHININKYASASQLEALRGHLVAGRATSAPVPTAVHADRAPVPVRRAARPGRHPTRKKIRDNTVFVIHGRDLALRDSMYAFLSALGCKPVEFHQAIAAVKGTGNPFTGAVLDKVFAQALVVLLSADDEAKLKDRFVKTNEKRTEGKLQGQARANVIFEAGMVMSRHQEKTVMVQVGLMKSFSDIFGRHMVHLDNNYASRNDFVGRLEKLCRVDRTGTTWTTTGNFVPAKDKKKRKKRTSRK